MAKGIDSIPTIQSVVAAYTPEQVLLAFDIPIDSSNKCLCPFHHETVPSMHVNEDYVYCFGCQTSADTYRLAKLLLSKKYGRDATHSEVLTFFKDNHLPAKTDRVYAVSGYQGDVPAPLVDYWVACMDDARYAALESERLIDKATAVKYHIGWRPDWEAWTIPFYRGEIGNSLIDVVQYRLTNSADKKKYLGLAGHNRGTVMNADLLDTPQPYVVVLFGAFDSIPARQEGIIAVGLNGSNPFKTTEQDRVRNLFNKQSAVIVVPDNTASEYSPAYNFAATVGGQVRFFPTDLPAGCDYIDYRKLGYTAQDFLQDVAGIEPITQPDPEMLANLISLLEAGDPFALSSFHAANAVKGQVVQDIARILAKQGPFGPFSNFDWGRIKSRLWQVRSQDDLCKTLDSISQTAVLLKNSAW